jgi:hypothetical protein
LNINIDAILIAAAGAVILAPYLIRRALWYRVNRRTRLAPTYAPGRVAITGNDQLAIAGVLVPAESVNTPYLTTRDWLSLHTARIEPDYEGLSPDDELDGESWVTSVRAAGYEVTAYTSDEIERQTAHAEREAQRALSDEFERFDRMCSRGLAHVETICAATIERWQDDWRQWEAEHVSEATQIELAETREWIEREKSANTIEFERIVAMNNLAEALLGS